METKDIIAEVVSQMNNTVVVSSVVDNTETQTINTKCTLWVSICDTLSIGGNKYLVDSFVLNESITVTPLAGAPLITAASFDLEIPFYLNGTIKMVQAEISSELDKEEVYPLIWLLEIIRDESENDSGSMIDRFSDIKIYFIVTVQSDSWLTEDHYKYAIYPMKQLVEEFERVVRNSKRFTYEFKSTKTNLLNISIEGKQEKGIFDYNISGVELRMFSEIRKDLSCNSEKC